MADFVLQNAQLLIVFLIFHNTLANRMSLRPASQGDQANLPNQNGEGSRHRISPRIRHKRSTAEVANVFGNKFWSCHSFFCQHVNDHLVDTD